MASLLFFCVYAYHLILPGYLIVRLLAIRRGVFLLAIAFSYSLLLLNLLPMEWLKTPLWTFMLAFNLQVGILLLANVVLAWYRRGARKDKASIRRIEIYSWNSVTNGVWRRRNRWWPPLAIVLGVLVYVTWAGPYMELPADPWRHVVRFLHAWHICIGSGHLAPVCLQNENWMPLNCFMRQGWHWFILQALLCRLSGLAITDLPGPLTVANTIVFCLAIYGFALFLWSRQKIRRRQKVQASLWSVVFTVLWLGVNIFAYIRYYALAPAILNYMIYLAAVILILDYLQCRSWWRHAAWAVPVFLAVLNVNHTQEAAFTVFMGLGMLVIMEGQWIWTRFCSNRSDTPKPTFPMPKIHLLFIGGLIVYCLMLYYSFDRPLVGYSAFAIKPLFQDIFLKQTWYIQPPTGQFFQVLTWWGVFVYALFLIYFRNFVRQPFILAGMLMPFLTVFNPLTLMILSRWMPDLFAIYRFNYMIPLPFVAGFLAMRYSNEIRLWVTTGWHKGLSSGIWKPGILAGGELLFLLLLLTPLDTLLGGRSNSRFYTLKPVEVGNDQRRWSDLIALVRKHPQVQILTDAYTFILLSWMDVAVMNGEWWIHPTTEDADRLGILRGLDRRNDWWLVVNRRNGDFSMNGYRSGHWSADALTHFATAYPEDALLFIQQHPELFKEIWSKDQIQVYDIVENRL